MQGTPKGGVSSLAAEDDDASCDVASPSKLGEFNIVRIAHACATARSVTDVYARLMQLREINATDLRPQWNSYVDHINTRAGDLRREEEAEAAAIRDEANQAFAAAERVFDAIAAEKKAALGMIETDLNSFIAAKRAAQDTIETDLYSFIAETTGFATTTWSKNAKVLGRQNPEHVLDSLRSEYNPQTGSAAGLEAAMQSYQNASTEAKRYPEMKEFMEDPAVVSFFSGASIASGLLFVILWATLGFGLGISLAALLFVGIMLIPVLNRSKAAEAYDELLDETANVQAWKQVIVNAERTKMQKVVNDARAKFGATKRAIQSTIDDARAKLDAKKSAVQNAASSKQSEATARFAKERNVTTKAFERGLSACKQSVDMLSREIAQAIDEQAVILGPPERCRSGDISKISLSDRMRYRLGCESPTPPSWPCAAAQDYLQLVTAPKLVPSEMVPTVWDFGQKHSLLITTHQPASTGAESVFSGFIARLLNQIPSGKANFTFFDPIGLGRNFSRFLRLSDYSDQLITGRVWSDKEHIRRKLKDLIEHIETVTQKYLRSDFPDIESYNSKAGEIAEPYRVLVVADFPESFDEEIFRDLVRIVQNGPRCGIFALIHLNAASKLPHGVDLEALRQFSAELTGDDRSYTYSPTPVRLEGVPHVAPMKIVIDSVIAESDVNEIVSAFGSGAQQAMRVQVPYQKLLAIAGLTDSEWWKSSSAGGIAVPLGRTGAKKVQMMRLGSGLVHHALIVGRPGSGKSNLVHVMITTIGRLYAPDEVQLYLIDFKKGVEFKSYAEANLPHARVIAIESEREFGLSVLEGLDAELKSRGEKFRLARCASISEYRSKTQAKLSRVLLIVDEFQEFFTYEDRIKREAEVLFDRLIKQGRAFGIHVVLGTQSLANAGLGRATQDQMAVRIALQCSEADSRLILGEDNTAARLLTRAGEAIYNDSAGLIEANNLFQVAFFSDEDRDRELELIAAAARTNGADGELPIIFEGHEPAQIEDCRSISALAAKELKGDSLAPVLWLGEPISLRPTTSVTLKRQAARNLMVLTRDEEQGVGVVLAAMMSIAAQMAPDRCGFKIVDLTSADAAWADHPEEFAASMPHHVEVLGRRDIKSVLPEIEAEVGRRTESGLLKEPAQFLAILGFHRARDLRQLEPDMSMSIALDSPDVSPHLGQTLARILRDGPEVGVHTLLWCDTFANLDRVLDRSSINEIGLRVAGPLSQGDSHRLFDDEVAATINRPHRMVKYDDDQVGAFEMFRPYALPSVEFIAALGKALKARI